MDEDYFKKITTAIILGVLIFMSFFLLKPIMLSIVLGMVLAFVFNPLYKLIFKQTKSPNLSATIVCTLLILAIILIFWYIIPIILDQSIKVYAAAQGLDFISPLKAFFPDLLASDDVSGEIGGMIKTFVTNTTNTLANSISEMFFNLPVLFMQSIVVFFTLFFVLRDNEKFVGYLKSLMPFSKEVENKLFQSSKDITSSVLYGQVVVGLAQGLTAGVGFFLFGVPNALLLTALACLAGIFPIIGTTIIWFPVAAYLFVAGNTFSAVGVFIFGFISSTIDNFLRPIIVSKRTKMPSSLIIIGMIGGLFMFGILGLILGPLIFAYLLVVLEIYRNKKIPGLLIKE